jgi:hypothetical protein
MAKDVDAVLVDLDEPDLPDYPAPASAEVVDLPDDGAEAPVAGALPAHAVKLPDGRVRLPLRFPVTLRLRQGGQERTETFEALVLRRMTGADLRAMANAGDAVGELVLARLAGIAQAKATVLYDRMDLSDITAMTDVVGFFGSAGRRNGR